MYFLVVNIVFDCWCLKSVVSSRFIEGLWMKYILLLLFKYVIFMVKYEWLRMGNSELLGDIKK